MDTPEVILSVVIFLMGIIQFLFWKIHDNIKSDIGQINEKIAQQEKQLHELENNHRNRFDNVLDKLNTGVSAIRSDISNLQLYVEQKFIKKEDLKNFDFLKYKQ